MILLHDLHNYIYEIDDIDEVEILWPEADDRTDTLVKQFYIGEYLLIMGAVD